MAEKDTLEAIREAIAQGESFVVEAGAGSGKTRSLIDTVQSVLESYRVAFARSGRQIVCITYTNVAKREISERLNEDPMVLVGTIHEFLWQVISQFQRELRAEVLELNSSAKVPIENLETAIHTQPVTYGQFGRHFDRGELSHDDVIAIAGQLFTKYPKISRIAADRYPFVFVDEYQDTSQTVVDLLLNHFVANVRKPVVGFFGDSMQQIYDSQVGDVAGDHDLMVISKPENYRCSVAVIGVLNRLRDDLEQVPSGDNKPGDVHLMSYEGDTEGSYKAAIAHLADRGWSLSNTKILMLTHKGIARELGFGKLLDAYNTRSFGTDLLNQREDEFGEFFTYVNGLVGSYVDKKYETFLALLGNSGFVLASPSDKVAIHEAMKDLIKTIQTGTVRDVAEVVTRSKLIPRPRRLSKLQQQMAGRPADDDEALAKKRLFYNTVLDVPWSHVQAFVDYADEHTPFSTKHGVKGAEFENVLVIIDDGLWNRYKFAQVFSNDASNPGRLQRSRKLLYVCFSRAMSGLAVLSLGNLAGNERAGAQELLGVDDITVLKP